MSLIIISDSEDKSKQSFFGDIFCFLFFQLFQYLKEETKIGIDNTANIKSKLFFSFSCVIHKIIDLKHYFFSKLKI